jgi:hypothetical protein
MAEYILFDSTVEIKWKLKLIIFVFTFRNSKQLQVTPSKRSQASDSAPSVCKSETPKTESLLQIKHLATNASTKAEVLAVSIKNRTLLYLNTPLARLMQKQSIINQDYKDIFDRMRSGNPIRLDDPQYPKVQEVVVFRQNSSSASHSKIN